MTRTCIRKNIALNDKKQLEGFKKFVKDGGFSSFSQMARHSIKDARKRFYEGSLAEVGQLQNSLDAYHNSLHKDYESLKERLELIAIRISKEGITSDVANALNDIMNLVLKRDMDHSQILSKLRKYDDKTVDSALCLAIDSDFIGHKRKNLTKK